MGFYDKFIKLCNDNDISPSRVAQDIGLNKSSVTYWKRGSSPNFNTIEKLSRYFKVSPAYFTVDGVHFGNGSGFGGGSGTGAGYGDGTGYGGAADNSSSPVNNPTPPKNETNLDEDAANKQARLMFALILRQECLDNVDADSAIKDELYRKLIGIFSMEGITDTIGTANHIKETIQSHGLEQALQILNIEYPTKWDGDNNANEKDDPQG